MQKNNSPKSDLFDLTPEVLQTISQPFAPVKRPGSRARLYRELRNMATLNRRFLEDPNDAYEANVWERIFTARAESAQPRRRLHRAPRKSSGAKTDAKK